MRHGTEVFSDAYKWLTKAEQISHRLFYVLYCTALRYYNFMTGCWLV